MTYSGVEGYEPSHVGSSKVSASSPGFTDPKSLNSLTGLMQFPDEILLLIISQIDDLTALRSLALACRRLQGLAEPSIYRSVLLTRGSDALHVAYSVQQDPSRLAMVEDMLISCPFNEYRGIEDLQTVIPLMSRLQVLRVETPDCNARNHRERRHWRTIQSEYESIFRDASLFELDRPRPLQMLRSCTVHFVDHSTSLYSLAEYCSLLMHPTLEELSLSCAAVQDSICRVLEGSERCTDLKRLKLEQCDFSERGLRSILSLQKGLESLHLSDKCHDGRMVVLMGPKAMVDCIGMQAHSLRDLSLLLALPHVIDRRTFNEKYDFSPFEKLTSFHFGQIPFYEYDTHPDIERFMRYSRINLDQVIFPVCLESFKYSHVQKIGFDMSVEILKSTFCRPGSIQPWASSTPNSTNSAPAYHSLKEIDITLALESHSFVRPELLHHLARPAPHFAKHGIHFRVYDMEGQIGFIPPFLYGEKRPIENMIIDSSRLKSVRLANNKRTRSESPNPEDSSKTTPFSETSPVSPGSASGMDSLLGSPNDQVEDKSFMAAILPQADAHANFLESWFSRYRVHAIHLAEIDLAMMAPVNPDPAQMNEDGSDDEEINLELEVINEDQESGGEDANNNEDENENENENENGSEYENEDEDEDEDEGSRRGIESWLRLYQSN